MHIPTKLIQEFSEGNSSALNELFEITYDELHALAGKQRNRWSGMETLNTVALVHEAYLKLWKHQPKKIENKRHFFAIAAKAMRQILVNYAEKRSAVKRGGHLTQVSSDEIDLIADDETAGDLLEMHQTLNRLEKKHERQAKVFECRFFGEMTVKDTAFALDISPATVKRDWQAACNYLYRELNK